MIEIQTPQGMAYKATYDYATSVIRYDAMPAPRAHEIIVRQIGRETMTSSGLHLPDAKHYLTADGSAFGAQRDEFPPRGHVLAVGSAVVDVQPGNEIYFDRITDAKTGQAVHALIPDTRLGGPAEWKDLLVMNERNVALVFEVSP